ncbi:hypothetical protein MJO52_09390 [Microbulbifer variabilis]|uniref:Uncharacterized protein n=1 Tax=Microbulbifer variabilis TaxID=266805 RepID=A0ABY4VG83_9GAMM|nr:hypothetical protein [Microbulbifer variabilis]USD23329.1 hypothetical protein MJO52_09390 [Microbulbifer variabilis]
MNDILLGVILFGLLVLGLVGIIFLIPLWVKVSTESEQDPNHLYSIFWEEAGFKGEKISSASGCLFPFIVLANPNFDIEGLILCIVVSVVCGLYHSSVYRGYAIITGKMKVAGVAALCMLTAVSFMVRYQALSSFYIIFCVALIGAAWGSYAVYRRAYLIRLERVVWRVKNQTKPPLVS